MFKNLLQQFAPKKVEQKEVLLMERGESGYPLTVEQIHNEFEFSGERLLNNALEILNQNGDGFIEKAQRLKRIGFANTKEAKKYDEIRVTEALANTIQTYSRKYPLNKFITKEQVVIICNKYGLVFAPTSNYTGFVPEVKLKEIEKFQRIFRSEDLPTPFVTNPKFSYAYSDESAIKRLKEKYPNGEYPLTGSRYVGEERITVDSFDVIGNEALHICAPAKDFDLKGLKKNGVFHQTTKHVEVPDPVVLQPVKDGYIVVAKWGDEASDPLLTNPIEN